MIQRQDMIPMLVSACPSFASRWDEGRQDDFLDADKNLLIYVALGGFARHLVELALADRVEEFPAIFEVVERLHVEGEDWVREAATIGLLEGIQNNASHTSLAQTFFEPFLRAESRKWWNSLNDFWDGKAPCVRLC